MVTVLVVDDQLQARKLLGAELEEAGFAVVEAADGEEGWRSFCERRPDVVVTDMVMPRSDGLELLKRIRSQSDVPVIVFSGHGSVETAAHAFKAGADDFVNSLDLEADALVTLIRDAATSGRTPPPARDLEQRLVGRSSAITRVRWQISGLAPLATPVLVSGEAGTGRTTALHALHELGSTSSGELVHIDAGAFSPLARSPEPENEARGGRTGAVHLRDVERLSRESQRYWADRLATGEEKGFRGRPRIFATTSAPLASLVRSGQLHETLGRVLLRFQVEMPPLRARSEDIPELVRALMERIGTSLGRTRGRLSPAASKYLENYRFPGNIRQLEQLLERATAYSRDRLIRKATLEELLTELEDSVESMREERESVERDRLLLTLQEMGGNITHTAEALGRSRASVYRLIEKHNIPLTRRG